MYVQRVTGWPPPSGGSLCWRWWCRPGGTQTASYWPSPTCNTTWFTSSLNSYPDFLSCHNWSLRRERCTRPRFSGLKWRSSRSRTSGLWSRGYQSWRSKWKCSSSRWRWAGRGMARLGGSQCLKRYQMRKHLLVRHILIHCPASEFYNEAGLGSVWDKFCFTFSGEWASNTNIEKRLSSTCNHNRSTSTFHLQSQGPPSRHVWYVLAISSRCDPPKPDHQYLIFSLHL